jgi:glycosyltransferase involved in cell wall biosynthesis
LPSLKIQKIAWIASTLHTAGGGSRLLLEGKKYYEEQGIEVLVITWDFNKESLFDGRYAANGIKEIDGSKDQSGGLTTRAFNRIKTIGRLRSMIIAFQPDVIFNQSEYDAALIKIALFGIRYRLISFIFGQMFQFPLDLAKYSFPFKKNFNEIRQSTPGYREFVPAARPTTRLRDIILAQAIAIPRYFAIRSSEAIFVFSKQVRWEVSKLYGASAHILKGAYPRSVIGYAFNFDRSKITDKPSQRIILSLSRLIEKKRVALKIEAMRVLIFDRKVQNIKLVIGGKGEEMPQLVDLAARLGLSEHVLFLGYVPEKDVYPLTQSCDVYTSLDVADFDISPYEALALKRKIVWSSEMDLDDYLGSCGAIFPAEPTPDKVADAIENALKQDENIIDWSGLERYSWESYFGEILSIIEDRNE